MSVAHDVEMDRNWDAFEEMLPKLMREHAGEFVLLKDQKPVAFRSTSVEAYKEGLSCFGDAPFSVQEVTDQPEDLGFYSHVGSALQA